MNHCYEHIAALTIRSLRPLTVSLREKSPADYRKRFTELEEHAISLAQRLGAAFMPRSAQEGRLVPIGSIQRILGHENRKTTEIYLHGLDESDRRAIEVYEETRTFSHTNSHTIFTVPRGFSPSLK